MMMLQSQTVFFTRGMFSLLELHSSRLWKLQATLLAVLFWWERELLLAPFL